LLEAGGPSPDCIDPIQAYMKDVDRTLLRENLKLTPAERAVEAFGARFLRVGLEKLIELKRAAGRPKDFESIAELEVLREEGRAQRPDGPPA
jgi:hypothetical protein